jgi:DNA-directed RNA polymerase alpha subunit/DNA-directed RNA polymerase subunit L
MNPSISEILDGDVLTFTMSNTNTSIANALRRTMIRDIPTIGIKTELYEQNQCQIEINTSRFHNEIVKHRLSCIPVHRDFNEHSDLPGNYVLELDVKNDTEHVLYVTTADFKLRSKHTGNLLSPTETRRIFPPCEKTNSYIDFLRLQPRLSESIPGEQIKLVADFSVVSPRESSTFAVVSKCTYQATPDADAARAAWEAHERELRAANMDDREIAFHRRNFMVLDAQRKFVADSYDFAVQSVGVYQNKSIVKKACDILCARFKERVEEIDAGLIAVAPSNTTMDAWDIIMQNEDYTVGKVIEFMLYERYFRGGAGAQKLLQFCGFKKKHPHDTESIIRVAYEAPVSADTVRGHFREQAVDAQTIFENIGKYFEERG